MMRADPCRWPINVRPIGRLTGDGADSHDSAIAQQNIRPIRVVAKAFVGCDKGRVACQAVKLAPTRSAARRAAK
jgi:hypothetical protein